MATGKSPFTDVDEDGSVLDALVNNEPSEIPEKQSRESFANFIERCLEKDGDNRPTLTDLMNHEFLVDAVNCLEVWR